MKRRGQLTAIYVETLIMIVVMIGILLILTRIFGVCRRESLSAGHLTHAITLAQSSAQVMTAKADLEESADLLGWEDVTEEGADGGWVCRGTCEDSYRMEARREEGADGLDSYRLDVYYRDNEEALYSLSFLGYTRGGGEKTE